MSFWAALLGAVVGGTFTLLATLLAHRFETRQARNQRLAELSMPIAVALDEKYSASDFIEQLHDSHTPAQVQLDAAEDIRLYGLKMRFWVKDTQRLHKSLETVIQLLTSTGCNCSISRAKDRWHHSMEERVAIQDEYSKSVQDALVELSKGRQRKFYNTLDQAEQDRKAHIKAIFGTEPCDQSLAPKWWLDDQYLRWASKQIPRHENERLERHIPNGNFYLNAKDQAALITRILGTLQQPFSGYASNRTAALAKFLSAGNNLTFVNLYQADSRVVATAHSRWLRVIGTAATAVFNGDPHKEIPFSRHLNPTPRELAIAVSQIVDEKQGADGLRPAMCGREVYDHIVGDSPRYESYEHWMIEHGCSVPIEDTDNYYSAAAYAEAKKKNFWTTWEEAKPLVTRPISEIEARGSNGLSTEVV